MASRKRREAIETIKKYYRENYDPFVSTFQIVNWLNDIGITCRYKQVLDWARQAQLELADAGFAVANPVHINGYQRWSFPSSDERAEARAPRDRDTHTRLVNDLRVAEGDTAQADVTKQEAQKVKLLELTIQTHQIIVEMSP